MKRYILLFILCGLSLHIYAQSLYDKQGKMVATKVGDNRLDVTGSTFLIEEGRLIPIIDNIRYDDGMVNYTRRTDNSLEYINQQGERVGYYMPSENRFYHVEPNGDKAVQAAFLYEGKVYTIDENPTFTLDGDFPPEWLGYVLFFFLGY